MKTDDSATILVTKIPVRSRDGLLVQDKRKKHKLIETDTLVLVRI